MNEDQAAEFNARAQQYWLAAILASSELVSQLTSLCALFSDVLTLEPEHRQKAEFLQFTRETRHLIKTIEREVGELLPDDTKDWFTQQMGPSES